MEKCTFKSISYYVTFYFCAIGNRTHCVLFFATLKPKKTDISEYCGPRLDMLLFFNSFCENLLVSIVSFQVHRIFTSETMTLLQG